MSRIRSFAGLAAAVLLVATALPAQAQTSNGYYLECWNGPLVQLEQLDLRHAPSGAYGGSVIDNNGTATIGNGDNVTDNASDGYIFLGDTGGNGYVNQSGGILNPGITTGALSPGYEALGVANSGIYTQSDGVNVPFADVSTGGNFSSLTLGGSNRGYGEYDLSGGSLGVNAIFVGGNLTSQQSSSAQKSAFAGTGVFTQTGGSVGAYGGLTTQVVGLSVGGNWFTAKVSTATYTSVGTYTLGNANGVGSPLFAGGVEAIGVNGTGTFTQNCGTNAIVGGGQYGGNMGGTVGGSYYNNAYGTLVLGWYGGVQKSAKYGSGVGTYNLNGGLLTGGLAILASVAWKSLAAPARESSPNPAVLMFPPPNSMSAEATMASSPHLLARAMEPTPSAAPIRY